MRERESLLKVTLKLSGFFFFFLNKKNASEIGSKVGLVDNTL